MEESAVYPSTPENVSHCPETPRNDTNSAVSDSNDESQDGHRGSPPPNCAICLSRCVDKCFTDSCLHQFCFPCLTQWSKVRAVCPLCKQSFKSIIHSVRSNNDYEQLFVEGSQTQNNDFVSNVSILEQHLPTVSLEYNRYSFRTTLTLHRSEELTTLHNYLLDQTLTQGIYGELVTDIDGLRRGMRGTGGFRASVYRFNLWAKPLPDITGRFRDCSPTFYRLNPSTTVRLVPWLNRELKLLITPNTQRHCDFVVNKILNALPRCPILSHSFYLIIHAFVGSSTEHFQHEFYEFARTPFDIIGYDRDIQYDSREYILQNQQHVISSTSETDDDSDVQIISPDHNYVGIRNNARIESYNDNDDSVEFINEEPALPSSASIPGPSSVHHNSGLDFLLSIETIANTSSDSDSDSCVVMGYLKPPEQRTPDLITLNSDSDSDVIINQDELTVPLPMAATEIITKTNDIVQKHSKENDISYSTENDFETVSVPKQNKPKTSKCIKLSKRKIRPIIESTDSSSSDSDFFFNRRYKYNNSRLHSTNGESSQTGSYEGQINEHSKSKIIIQPIVANVKKGKTIIKPNPENKVERLLKRRHQETCSSNDSSNNDDCNSSASTKTKKLKSVVIKTNPLNSKTNPSATQNNPVFKEIKNEDEYSIGPSYYNNIIPSVLFCDESISDISAQDPCTANICDM